MVNEQSKPAALKDEHIVFLDVLRESGETNMFGAAPFLRDGFPRLSIGEAREILAYWMRTFHERHPA